jgi:hypothetical protein
VRFGGVQEAEIQTTVCFCRQSVMQYCFMVMSVGRPFELIGADGIDIQRMLSHDEAI